MNLLSRTVPENFKIVPLPSEIISWATSLLQRLPRKEQLQEQHMRTKLGCEGDGRNGAKKLDLNMTTSSSLSTQTKGSECSELSPWPFGKDNFCKNLVKPWLKAQSKVPSHMWFRPSGRTIDQTPPKTKTESLVDFYQGFLELSRMMIQKRNSKKPSRKLSSENSQK